MLFGAQSKRDLAQRPETHTNRDEHVAGAHYNAIPGLTEAGR